MSANEKNEKKLIYDKLKMNNIRVVNRLNGKEKFVKLEVLTNTNRKKGNRYLYEYLNPKLHIYVNPYFDIDDKTETLDLSSLHNKTIKKLNSIFLSKNEDWAISSDHRKGKKSFHLVLSNVKTTIQDLINFKNENMDLLKSLKIDPKVYRAGDSKFRTIFSKKDSDENANGFTPINFLHNLEAHIIQYVPDDCVIWKYNQKLNHPKNTIQIPLNNHLKDVKISKSQEDVLKKYKFKGSIHKKEGYYTVDIDCKCPFGENHLNNNRYLTITTNYIKLRCWSDKCNDKEQVVWQQNQKDEIHITTTDDNLAKLFKRFYGDDFIYVYEDDEGKSGSFYYYNKKYWVYDKNNKHISLSIANDFYLKLDELVNTKFVKKQNPDILKLKKSLLKLQSQNKILNVIARLKHHLHKDITFDTNPYYIVFNNGVYDLKNFKFITNTDKKQYVSNFMNTGYDYQEKDDTLMLQFQNNYINKVLINPQDDKLTFLKFFSTCLLGKRYKKFIIANGSGNNAKSGLFALTKQMIGLYGYKLNVKDLCVGKKDTAEMNNLHLKRFLFTEEPDSSNMKFDGNFIKDLTGSDENNFRKMYSARNSIIKNHSTMVIGCNAKAPINTVDEAIKERIIDFPFKATFTNVDVDNITRFKADVYYDTNDFREKYKMTLFHFLLPYLKLFYQDKEQVVMTKNLKQRVETYLLESDEFYSWFKDTYEFVDKKEFDERDDIDDFIIKFKNIYKCFKRSSYYMNLPRSKKRQYNKKKFEEELLSRKLIKKYWRERFQPTDENGVKLSFTNCFVQIKERDEEECEIEFD